jgi:uncharacterized protein (TIGR00730 family)
MSLSVCVFCSSSDAIDPSYRTVATDLGAAIAREGWALVYGGGDVGLMGEVARAALAGGAHVTGVIPHRLADREIALHDVTELIRTDTMRERKALMDERADAFVVLPGGIGTLEELVEIVTLKQLGYHDRAIIVVDCRGYWDPVLSQFQRMVDERMADETLLGLYDVVGAVDDVVTVLQRYRPPPSRADKEREAVEAAPQGRAREA